MIDRYAFFESGLESIEFPSTLEVIEDSAFSICSSLHSVKFSEGIKKIDNYVFFKCGFESITFPPTVEMISYGAFS